MSKRHRVLLSWSTGKDSAWLLHELRRRADVEVVGLLTTVEAEDTVAYHRMPVEWLHAQAAAAGLPLRKVELPRDCPDDLYRERMGGAFQQARQELGAAAVAFGDLHLADLRRWREEHAGRSGLAPLFPLWGQNTRTLAQRMIDGGQEAMVIAVDTERLPAALAGRAFDRELLDVLPDGIDACGENGEFHTLVWKSPAFTDVCTTRRAEVARTTLEGTMAYAIPEPPSGVKPAVATW